MGRGTHEAADKPERRRVILSRQGADGVWRRPTQLWIDPTGLRPVDLEARVRGVRPMVRALILGGTGVHDWFHAQRRIDEVLLTIEPQRFGTGLPIFSGQGAADPVEVLTSRGYSPRSDRRLNAAGTRLVSLRP